MHYDTMELVDQKFSFMKQLRDSEVITHDIITFIYGADELVVKDGGYDPKTVEAGSFPFIL